MATAAFDTLQAARELRRAGFDQPKAEALVELMRQRDSDLATKADIARLEEATKEDIARLEGATKADIARLEGATKAEFARLEEATKAEFARLEGSTKAEFARLEGSTKAEFARLEEAIVQLEGSINQLRNWFVSGLITILVAILTTAFLPG